MLSLQFLGAAGEVTGSKTLIQAMILGQPRKILVECGMFQGGKDATEKNLAPFGFSPNDLDCVILTHAHIDHSGLLPRLCAKGFAQKIYCTPGTLELLKILLMDSAHLQQANRERAERRLAAGHWRGDLPEPLYSTDDVAQCLSQFQTIPYGKTFSPFPGMACEFQDAGHILGASIVIMDLALTKAQTSEPNMPRPKRLVFSGDLGSRSRPLMHDPQRIAQADILVMESTYGNRMHRSMKETEDELVEVMQDALSRSGNVIMPAFAVGRTQEVLYLLLHLVRQKRLPFMTIFVDSPMATAASQITQRFMQALDPETQDLYHWYTQHPEAVQLHFVADVEASKRLNLIKGGAVIISASGMCEAGRIVHHLSNNLPRSQSAVVITGFQAAGTKGRQLVDGALSIRLLGQDVPVRASIHTLGGLSAHADQADLLWWLKGFESAPEKIFLIHGEAIASEQFATAVRDQLGWGHISLPQRGTVHTCD
jgi:metallo-beta-lactamase family protein